tara:strand:+ start:6464 stop:6661 length:198 start_codon:yes stop_codon:yes gene_type:complete
MKVGDLVRHTFSGKNTDLVGIIVEFRNVRSTARHAKIEWQSADSVGPQWFPEDELVVVSPRAEEV